MMRLDKYISLSGERSRTESGRLIRSGAVTVDGKVVRDPSVHIPDGAQVLLKGAVIRDSSRQYYLFHKPAGVLTAARDHHAETVMDLLPEALRHRDVLPVGRLDKDTTGLLLITNDGQLAHALLHPDRHVWKRYEAVVEGMLMPSDEEAFQKGIPLKDFTCLPAEMHILESSEETSRAEVFVREGKFHQIKRMFSARGHEVLQLHRSAFGPLTLPADLLPGEYRELTGVELQALCEAAGIDYPTAKE